MANSKTDALYLQLMTFIHGADPLLWPVRSLADVQREYYIGQYGGEGSLADVAVTVGVVTNWVQYPLVPEPSPYP